MNFQKPIQTLLQILPIIFLPFLFCQSARGQTITTFAGTGVGGYTGNGGLAISAQLDWPLDIRADALGNLYIADSLNNVVQEVNTGTGIINVFAGTGTGGYTGDGGPAISAQLNRPMGLVFDPLCNLILTDYVNSVVRRINLTTGIITTIAGTGTAGFSGDGGLATSAQLNQPSEVAYDSSGNLYITDDYNFRVREVNALTGVITTIAGNGTDGYGGDGGPATSASFTYSVGLALDSSGNVYISDGNDNRIRKVNIATGIITTVAGTGVPGYTGDGGLASAAQIDIPGGITFDCTGELYLCDSMNNVVRRVNFATGIINTVAGSGSAVDSGDGGPALSAGIDDPRAVAFDSAGNLFVSEENGQRVRKIASATTSCGPTLTGCGPTPTATPIINTTFTPTTTSTITFTGTPSPTFSPTPTITPPCSIQVWPDPYSIQNAYDHALRIGCLPPGTQVCIYDVSGELVNKIASLGDPTEWIGGKNLNGITVSTGIYYYVVQNGQTVLRRGKFLIIH